MQETEEPATGRQARRVRWDALSAPPASCTNHSKTRRLHVTVSRIQTGPARNCPSEDRTAAVRPARAAWSPHVPVCLLVSVVTLHCAATRTLVPPPADFSAVCARSENLLALDPSGAIHKQEINASPRLFVIFFFSLDRSERKRDRIN